MWVIASNSISIFIIILIDTIRMIIVWIYRKCVGTKLNPEQNVMKITPKIAMRAKHLKFVEENKIQTNHESTLNPSTIQLREESKFDIYDDASNMQMKRAKNWD